MRTRIDPDEVSDEINPAYLLTLVYIFVVFSFFLGAIGLLFFIICSVIYLATLTFLKELFFNKFRNLFRLLIVIIIVHLVTFPLIYVEFLKNDSKSFKFNDYISNLEKQYSLNRINNKYNPENLVSKILYIDSIFLEKDEKLKSKLSYINSKNLVVTDKYSFFLGNNLNGDSGRGDNPFDALIPELIIGSSNGNYILSLDGDGTLFFENDSLSLNEFLFKKKTDLELHLTNYNSLRSDIVKSEKFWTFEKIFPYSLNIFDNSNLIPMTRSANIATKIHMVILYGFIAWFIGLFLSHVVRNK